MLTKVIGLYLIIDGIGSWLIYRKQKLIITKKKIVSSIPLVKTNLKKFKKAEMKIRTFRQHNIEHFVRFVRAGIGLGLLIAPLPF